MFVHMKTSHLVSTYFVCVIDISHTSISASTPPPPPQAHVFERSSSLPPNHPHARKQSVTLDGQLLEQSPLTLPYPSSASNSAFSLSLDPIAESTSSPFSAAASSSSIPVTPSTAGYLNGHSQQPRRPSQLGHGPPPPYPGNESSSRPASASLPLHSNSKNNTELILYSYAQLIGTLSITPIPGAAPPTLQQAHTLNALRSNLLKRSVVGGGAWTSLPRFSINNK